MDVDWSMSPQVPTGSSFSGFTRLIPPTPRSLAGTDGAAYPFWSPDSRFVGFFAEGRLKKIDAAADPRKH